ncbi:uncharacterized protein PODANS_3_6490 [Podospora anserina S mat+]|uniref:Type 1 phosphatases regulator n=1 Tax=Podospora anserina (strain S / ATCC MYA-4624 / DSM 980 / FGSC 10383) TaxID=515849 RepID=B2B068_PODAN|nr:uncharacterized protein PODANS_3_6490 [Podospora anserina S mat+]CAP70585.1 unnamed protein product [Podospora anserina S mat+]CDP27172.1 Putative protein of unknown function [Podospora anserina S mat+]
MSSNDTPSHPTTQQHQREPRTGTISTTQTIITTSTSPPQAILRLRGAHAPSSRTVQWSEDVIDNEGLNRKKSKVCCIYHRPKGVDESSSESSSSDSSDSDSDSDGGKGDLDRQGKSDGGRRRVHNHNDDDKCNGHHHHHHSRGRKKNGDEGGSKRRKRKPSPNAYEKMPDYGIKPPGKGKDKDTSGDGGPMKA